VADLSEDIEISQKLSPANKNVLELVKEYPQIFSEF